MRNLHRRRLILDRLEARTVPTTLGLSVAMPTVVEHTGANAAVATLIRSNFVSSAALTVNLSSSDTSEATVPASVVIPQGKDSVTFNVAAVDDALLDGKQPVQINASAAVVNLTGPISRDLGVSQSGISSALAVMSDGRVVVAGSYYTGVSANPFDFIVSRYNPDGTPDLTFNGTGSKSFDVSGNRDIATAVVLQPDNKIIVGGYGFVGGANDFILARLTSTGALDGTFGTGGKVVSETGPAFYNELWDLVLLSDGKILAGGNVEDKPSVVRYSSAGVIDPTYGIGGIASSTVVGRGRGLIRNPDNSVVLAGDTNDGNWSSKFSFVKFTTTGALDGTFGTSGMAFVDLPGNYDGAFELARQIVDGKLVAVGQVGRAGTFPATYDLAVVRLDVNGTPDGTFGTNGIVVTDAGGSGYMAGAGVGVQIDGRVVAAGLGGATGNDYIGVARYSPTGVLEDSNFTDGIGTTAPDISVRLDGTVWVASGNGFGGQLERFRSNAIATASAAMTVNDNDTPPTVGDDSYTVTAGNVLAVEPPAAGNGTTAITMTSQPGDWIGQGLTYNFTPATGTFTASRNFANGVSVFYKSATDNFNFVFALPGNVTLTPGTAFGAERYPFHNSFRPGLDVSGNGAGSSKLNGQFTITEALYDAVGNVVRFAASFEQHSDGAAPALTGAVRFNALDTPMPGVLGNDSEAGGGYLQAAIDKSPANGTVSLRADGTFRYTPNAGFTGSDSFTYKATNGSVFSAPATVHINVLAALPAVDSVQINGGAAQRSRVDTVKVTFNTVVDPAPLQTAFTMVRPADAAAVGQVNVSSTVVNGKTEATLTFAGANTVGNGSLTDGLWRLTVLAGQVVSPGGAMAADFTFDTHRLFGDADGDRDVDAVDYGAFRPAFGGATNPAFDSDGDGDVDAVDFGQLRLRFGSSI